MDNIILGGVIVIISFIYLFLLLKRRLNKISNMWSVSMLYKGLAGAILLIVIGIILMVNGYNSLD